MKKKSFFLVLILLCLICTNTVFANETNTITITQFKDTSGKEINIKYKMPLNDLLEKMPIALWVKLNDDTHFSQIPVTWECVDSYEDVMYGIYAFVPKPVDENIVISSALTNMDIPYVQVTVDSEFQDDENEIRVSILKKNGECIVIKVNKLHNVLSIKKLLQEILAIPIEEQSLLLNGKELIDSEEIAEQGILHEDIITLIVKSDEENTEDNPIIDPSDEPIDDGSSSNHKDPSPDYNDKNPSNNTNRIPKTNDSTSLLLWIGLTALSLFFVCFSKKTFLA